MKAARKSLIVVGAVLALAASQVLAQPGNGWGRGPRRGAGPGAGQVAQAPGPMGPGMGPGMGMGRGMGPGMGMGRGMGGPAGGGPSYCPWGPGRGGRMRLGSLLNLTDEQIKQIRTIHQNAQTDTQATAKEVAAARDALHQAVTSGAGAEQVREAAAKLGTAIGNEAALHAKTVAAVKAVLTDQQRAELEKIQANPTPRQRGWGLGMGRGPRAGRGFAAGRGFGPGCGFGAGRGLAAGRGPAADLGLGAGPGPGAGRGPGAGLGPGAGRGPAAGRGPGSGWNRGAGGPPWQQAPQQE